MKGDGQERVCMRRQDCEYAIWSRRVQDEEAERLDTGGMRPPVWISRADWKDMDFIGLAANYMAHDE